MRVLHVTPYFAPAFGFGGPPQSILSLCRALPQAGIDVEVFTTTANPGGDLPPFPDGTIYDGVQVRYFPVEAPRVMLGSRALLGALDASADEADVIHIHGLFNATSWAGARVARRHRRPLVVSIRGMLEPAARANHATRKHAAWALFDRRTVRDASLVHCTSASERRSVSAVTPATALIEIPNPVDLDLEGITDASRRRLHAARAIPEGRRIILFLGRLHAIKRLDLAAAAFAHVAQRFDDVDFVIAGEGHVDRAGVNRAAGESAARIHWIGPVYGHDRDVLLTTASALVLCSDSENFGMSVVEALAASVPPVVTETCPWELLEQTGAGRWVPQTAEAIALGLTDVLGDTVRAREMGTRGRDLARARFSPHQVAQAWKAAYESIASVALADRLLQAQ